MTENWIAIVAILAAAKYSKSPALQHLMLWLLIIVELYLFAVPFNPHGAYYDAYYLGIATLITIAACVCVTLIHGHGSLILAASLSVWAVINATMFMGLDIIHSIYLELGDIIVIEMISLAWYAAVKSRVD